MKFERFLNLIQEKLKNGTGLDLSTVKRIVLMFRESLSMKEVRRWNTKIEMILGYKSVQTSLTDLPK